MFSMIPASMPTVSPRRDVRRCLSDARRLSAGVRGERWVVIIAPDGTLIRVPVPALEDAVPSLLRDTRTALAPDPLPTSGLDITAIICTNGVRKLAHSFHGMLPLVPNLSYLVGAACLGNTVVAFEGQHGDVVAGCEGADMLLVDDGMVPLLQPDWAAVAVRTLRQPRVIFFGRDGKLKRLDRVVEVEGGQAT
jgi:hypothetical protein